jgi:RNA polymerase sigma factor for flagellar operon FliA
MLKQYSPLVRRLAHQMIAKLPANVEIDDLIQVGMIGLTDALSRFDAGQGVMFETFATQRIRGAMLDELRGADWMSRGNRKHQRDIETALHRLEQKLGRAPSEGEIAKEMGVSLAEYQDLLNKVRGTQLIYLEDMSGEDGDNDYLDRHVVEQGSDPLARLADHRMRQALVDAIKNLPEREQYVMSMYYEEDMNLKEIAAVLGVTESRVCQLHSQSIARLRTKRGADACAGRSRCRAAARARARPASPARHPAPPAWAAASSRTARRPAPGRTGRTPARDAGGGRHASA